MRLYLLLFKKEQIVEAYPIDCLDRKNISKPLTFSYSNKFLPHLGDEQKILKQGTGIVSLKNGRIIRTVETAPSMENRKWKSVIQDSPFGVEDKKLDLQQINAEIIYICKPLIHLVCMYGFGSISWKPWLMSLLLDITSLRLMSKTKPNELAKFSKRQQTELTRRHVALFWYLMRSPFYDYKTKMQILAVLNHLSRIPLVGTFSKSLIEYLPQWHQTYFYLWSS